MGLICILLDVLIYRTPLDGLLQINMTTFANLSKKRRCWAL